MPHTLLHQNHLIQSFHQQIDETTLNHCIKLALNNKKTYLAFSFKVNEIDTLAALEQVSDVDDFQFYWEKTSDEFSISSGGELARIVNEGPKRFQTSSYQGKSLLNSIYHYKAIKTSECRSSSFWRFFIFEKMSQKHGSHLGHRLLHLLNGH